MDEYRWKVRTIEAFIKQLTHYIHGGHYFYFACRLRDECDAGRLDAKILGTYRIALKRHQRTKRCRGSSPSIHYLRWNRFYVITSTYGKEPADGSGKASFFEDHGARIRDIRRKDQPLIIGGYSIHCGFSEKENRRKVIIQLNRKTFLHTRAELIWKATQPRYHSAAAMEAEFRKLPFQGYGPVIKQLGRILQTVNKKRRQAHLPAIGDGCICKKVKPTKVFCEDGKQNRAAA